MTRMGQIRASGLGAALVVGLAAGHVSAEKVNPYLTIAERNAFGLADGPPPPPPPPAKPEPPKPVSTVRLSGITTMLEKARALFEITEAPGKPMKKPIMLVGDKVGDIELLAINVEEKQVTIRQSGVETNLVLEARKAQAAPAAGPRHGMAPGVRPRFPPGVRPPGQQTAAANMGGAAPVVIAPGSSGTSSGRSGVITVGGNSSTPAAAPSTSPGIPASGSRVSFTAKPRAPAAFTPSVPSASSLRMAPQIPPRTARTQSTGRSDITGEKQLLLLHLNEVAAPGDGPPPPPID